MIDQASSERTAEDLFRVVYDRLHTMAERSMRQQAKDHTLQPTALVNEVYLRLGEDAGPWADREHFLRVAARAMRQILVDHGRRRSAAKRPPSALRVELVDWAIEYESRSIDLVELDLALEKLETREPRLAQLVELHFFGGQPMEACAAALGISERQAYRLWRTARALLHRELRG